MQMVEGPHKHSDRAADKLAQSRLSSDLGR